MNGILRCAYNTHHLLCREISPQSSQRERESEKGEQLYIPFIQKHHKVAQSVVIITSDTLYVSNRSKRVVWPRKKLHLLSKALYHLRSLYSIRGGGAHTQCQYLDYNKLQFIKPRREIYNAMDLSRYENSFRFVK